MRRSDNVVPIAILAGRGGVRERHMDAVLRTRRRQHVPYPIPEPGVRERWMLFRARHRRLVNAVVIAVMWLCLIGLSWIFTIGITEQ